MNRISYKDHHRSPFKIALPSSYLILFFLSWSQSMWQSATVVETALSRYEFIIMVNQFDLWEWWCIMMLNTMLGWWPNILVRRWSAWRFRVSRMAPPDSSRYRWLWSSDHLENHRQLTDMLSLKRLATTYMMPCQNYSLQLWVRTKLDESPYPLIGHEIPLVIKVTAILRYYISAFHHISFSSK